MRTISSVFLGTVAYCGVLLGSLLGLCVRPVGQEPAPSECVLMITSRTVLCDMRGRVVTDEGDRWSVKLDVRDLGETFGHYLSWLVRHSGYAGSSGISRLVLVYVLPLDFHCRLRVIRTMFIPGALPGIVLPSLQIRVCVSYALPFFGLYGLVDSLLPMLGQCLA